MKKLFIYLVFAALFVSLPSCGDGIVNNPDIVFPDSLVSYTNHVYPFMKQTCSMQGCHAEINPQGNINLSDWHSLIVAYNGVMVVAGKPDASLLVQMLEYTIPHDPMIYWNSSDNQVKGIRKWIAEGAKLN